MYFSLLCLLLVHPVHETVAEIEWNPKSHRVEVALRLDILDEQWLAQQETQIKAGKNWRLKYVEQKFRVTKAGDGNQPLTSSYHWVGRQQKGPHVWWFFEIEPRSGRCPKILEHRILFEKESNQANRVILLGTQPTQTRIHTTRNPRQTIFDEKKNVQPK